MAIAKKLSNKAKPKVQESSRSRIPSVTDLNVPSDNFLDYCTLIYGTKGIGKTTLCASLSPKTLVLMLEPKRMNLEIRARFFRPVSVPEIESGMEIL
jgi:hypothetical protein